MRALAKVLTARTPEAHHPRYTMIEEHEIASEVYLGIVASLAEAASEDRQIAGYALLTDDALETLSCATLWIGKGKQVDPDVLFSPVDWGDDHNDTPFRSAAAMLSRGLADRALSEHVSLAFRALVSAAMRARETHLGRATFVSVTSTDPSEHLEGLSDRAIAQLNTPALVERHQAWVRKWSGRRSPLGSS